MSYQSKHQGQIIDNNIDIINEFLNKTYPVGSIYMNINNTNPGTLFGGTWEQIQDRFLLAAGSSYEAGTTGGTASHTHTTAEHTLTIDEMPSHSHKYAEYVGLVGWQSSSPSNIVKINNTDGYTNTYNDGTLTTFITGGGASHSHGDTGSSSNLPPYLTVYIWRRIA